MSVSGRSRISRSVIRADGPCPSALIICNYFRLSFFFCAMFRKIAMQFSTKAIGRYQLGSPFGIIRHMDCTRKKTAPSSVCFLKNNRCFVYFWKTLLIWDSTNHLLHNFLVNVAQFKNMCIINPIKKQTAAVTTALMITFNSFWYGRFPTSIALWSSSSFFPSVKATISLYVWISFSFLIFFNFQCPKHGYGK